MGGGYDVVVGERRERAGTYLAAERSPLWLVVAAVVILVASLVVRVAQFVDDPGWGTGAGLVATLVIVAAIAPGVVRRLASGA